MDREYKQDKKYWVRMSADLRVASALITQILCEHDYNLMMPKAIWEKLATAGYVRAAGGAGAVCAEEPGGWRDGPGDAYPLFL